MSAQHTPGRLEVAVEVFDNEGCPETVIQGMSGAASVAVCIDFGENNPGMRYANARRLVACWNACEGISTEALESEGSAVMGWTRTASKLIRATTQRDELLAALKSAISDCEVEIKHGGQVCVDLEAMQAAVAKVEGT